MQPESGVGVAHVGVDGVGREAELFGDSLLRLAGVDQCEHLHLCWADLMVKLRAADDAVEPAFSSKRAGHILEAAVHFRGNVWDVVERPEVAAHEAVHYPETIVRLIERALLVLLAERRVGLRIEGAQILAHLVDQVVIIRLEGADAAVGGADQDFIAVGEKFDIC